MKAYIRHSNGLIDAAQIIEYNISADSTALTIRTAATRPDTDGHTVATFPQRSWREGRSEERLATAQDAATALVVALTRAEALSTPHVITHKEDANWTLTPLTEPTRKPSAS